ncbi:unnamed protein product [Rotaria magnacalcarata]|uniref:VCBS repeat-containing protein n=1 Tax=Rotaria magnacalcarata TaxID=392030 RepID=A0A816SZD8_9BILA|nr:unnamed protein product [Rotaria magnacalcarata]CAF2094684.1 unnamed protein product [Rotaria magnacalcarata]CAF4121902.1 unnamed protein product [Rotaria magnacalcarata]CAF4212542.1 unnamed protein product [Rotaria magnacalcarata]
MTYAAGSLPYSVNFGDFNSDNRLDIVVVNSGNPNMGIFFGYGNGNFPAQVTYSVSPLISPYSVAVGDFNNDNRLDTALSDRSGSSFGVLLGNGNGTFRTIITYSTGSVSYAIAVGDFNNDSKLDIVIANFATNNIGIFLGNGNGTFGAQKTFSTSSSPYSITVGDFNNDG